VLDAANSEPQLRSNSDSGVVPCITPESGNDSGMLHRFLLFPGNYSETTCNRSSRQRSKTSLARAKAQADSAISGVED